MSANLREINLPGIGPIRVPADMVSRINTDGTLTCRICGNTLPLQTDPKRRAVGIIWNHQVVSCRSTERELMS